MIRLVFCFLAFGGSAALWGNYPEDVYFFDLAPASWEYFVSQDNDKISIYRTLDIQGQDFFLNVAVWARIQKEDYSYRFTFSLDEKGSLFLSAFNDGQGAVSLPKHLFFPWGGQMGRAHRVPLAQGIYWEIDAASGSDFRSPRTDVLGRLSVSRQKVEFLFRYQEGVSGIFINGKPFQPVTRREFNAIP